MESMGLVHSGHSLVGRGTCQGKDSEPGHESEGRQELGEKMVEKREVEATGTRRWVQTGLSPAGRCEDSASSEIGAIWSALSRRAR